MVQFTIKVPHENFRYKKREGGVDYRRTCCGNIAYSGILSAFRLL